MCQPYLGLCFVNATYQSQTGVSLPNNNAWNLKIKKLAIVGQPLNQKTNTIQCSMVMSHETPPWPPVFSPDTYARNPPVSRCRSANRVLLLDRIPCTFFERIIMVVLCFSAFSTHHTTPANEAVTRSPPPTNGMRGLTDIAVVHNTGIGRQWYCREASVRFSKN